MLAAFGVNPSAKPFTIARPPASVPCSFDQSTASLALAGAADQSALNLDLQLEEMQRPTNRVWPAQQLFWCRRCPPPAPTAPMQRVSAWPSGAMGLQVSKKRGRKLLIDSEIEISSKQMKENLLPQGPNDFTLVAYHVDFLRQPVPMARVPKRQPDVDDSAEALFAGASLELVRVAQADRDAEKARTHPRSPPRGHPWCRPSTPTCVRR